MNTLYPELDQFARFRQSLDRSDLVTYLRAGLIGENVAVPGPDGPHSMVYADYVASGRALSQIENFVTSEILPFYANSHTEASYCGQMMTRLRKQARQIILDTCGGNEQHAVIFTGSGATAGLNRLVGLMGISDHPKDGPRPLVLIGPYEHHSNILPWRESGAEIIEIPEAEKGGPDMGALETALQSGSGRLMVGAFSAASNVTGIMTDVAAVTSLLKSYKAKSIWDYAGGAPYLPIDMNLGMDAVVVSSHKFIGGPGASGLMILRRDAVALEVPTLPGGGTVRFVSPWAHDYSEDVIAREEGGTPNVVGDIRAALCFIVKDAIGQNMLSSRLEELRQRALSRWADVSGLQLVGNQKAQQALPIFSFRITTDEGMDIHQQLVTRVLSDHFGIQARGGCACAGPYAHRLLDIDADHSSALRKAILSGREIEKPGWTRLGFSVLMSDEKADRIINAVAEIARNPQQYISGYLVDENTARFTPEAA